MKHVVAIACFVATGAVAQMPGLTGWRALDESVDPRDKKLVAEIEKMKWWDACIGWGRLYRSHKDRKREQALLDFLEYKNLLLDVDRGHVGDRTVAIGMSECGVFAAKGQPDGGINHTETAYGRTSQFVYSSSHTYVYTEERRGSLVNVVRAVQY